MPRDYDDEFDERPRRRNRRDEDDDYDPRPPARQVSILGIFSLVKGVGALVTSFMPCVGAIAILPGALGLFLGVIGLVVAKKSNGRQGTGLPVAGMSVSAAAILIALAQLLFAAVIAGRAEREAAQAEARDAQDGADRQARAAKDVKAAGDAVKITAVELDRAYDTDEDAADTAYGGKVLEVTGVVQSVDLEDDTAFVVELRGLPDSTVDCEFAKDPVTRARLARLRPGETVTIRGRCEGKDDGAVTLEACELVR